MIKIVYDNIICILIDAFYEVISISSNQSSVVTMSSFKVFVAITWVSCLRQSLLKQYEQQHFKSDNKKPRFNTRLRNNVGQ